MSVLPISLLNTTNCTSDLLFVNKVCKRYFTIYFDNFDFEFVCMYMTFIVSELLKIFEFPTLWILIILIIYDNCPSFVNLYFINPDFF